MTLTDLIGFTLATWRLASLLTSEDGPGYFFQKIRELAGITHDEDGNILEIPDTFLAGILSCVWCCSIWVAAGWVFIWLVSPKKARKLSALFAVSAGAIMIDRVAKG